MKNICLLNRRKFVPPGLPNDDDAFVVSLRNDVLLSCRSVARFTEDVTERMGLEICKKIISRFHCYINTEKLSASTSTADLGFDWFDNLQLLAFIEMVFDKDVFPHNMEHQKFNFAEVITFINERKIYESLHRSNGIY